MKNSKLNKIYIKLNSLLNELTEKQDLYGFATKCDEVDTIITRIKSEVNKLNKIK